MNANSVNVDDCNQYICECGADLFKDVLKLYEIPALSIMASQAPNGFIFKQYWQCLSCGKVNDISDLVRKAKGN